MGGTRTVALLGGHSGIFLLMGGRNQSFFLGNPSIHPSLEHSSPTWNRCWESSCGSLEKAKVWIPSAWKGEKKPPIKRDLQFQEGCSGKNISRGIHSAGGLCTGTQQFHQIHTRKNGNSTPEVLPAGLWWLQEGVTATPSDSLRCRRCSSGCTMGTKWRSAGS